MNRNKGFSLVELICTVAVMGVILTSISGAMIIASHNYSNGTVNVELQQETQTTSNLLSNLVIDSKTLEVAGLSETGDSDGTIKITATDESLVTIAYDTATKELTYSKQLMDGSIEDGILASGVTYFYADASSYSVDKNVYFTMGLSDFNDDKEFKTSFSVTSRNITLKNDYSSMAAISAKRFAIIEPGQTLNLPCKVLESSEGYTVGAVTGATDSNTSVAPLDGEHVLIRCGGDEKAVSFYFDVETVERRVDADGNVTSDPVDKKVIQVNVRRVTDIRIITQSETTFDNTADRIYVIKAELIGNNLEKQDYAYGDEDYVSPYKIDFRVLGTGSFCGSGYGGWNNYFNGEGDTLRVSGQRVEYRFKKVGREVDKTKYPDPSDIKFTIRVRAWHTYGYTDSIAWFGQEPSNKTRLTYYGNDLKDSLNILNADTDGGSTNERVLINYENAHSSELLYKDVVFKFKDSNEEIGVFSHPSALRRG
ncbi:MAG: prepilin-type N-terminal cleavage/methylation domain-containing protein, partial [Lachnospiraceae bacterium]|nr:prepilin-type N-terminal cleavage/methylation domain-containing protein [Candidatus Merdinaster equi]